MLKFLWKSSGANFCKKALAVDIFKENIWHASAAKNIFFNSHNIIRNTSFFAKSNSEELWKSVTCVSKAGKRRGRGRGNDRKRKVNLYKTPLHARNNNMFWPGFTGPIIQSNTLLKIHKQPAKETEDSDVSEPPTLLPRSKKIHPLLRGWSGRKNEGRKFGSPSPILDMNFSDFESIVIQNKFTSKMTGNLGRKRGYKVTTLIGNKAGLIGMGRGNGSSFMIALRKSKNQAIKKLIAVDIYENRTVYHSFSCEFGCSKLFVFPKAEGYGLKCHRALRECCYLLGIKDIIINTEGTSNNIIHIVRAFLLGLLYKQKSFQQLADETNLHVVQLRKETFYYPEVMASPSAASTPNESKEKPIFDHYVMDNQVYFNKKLKMEERKRAMTDPKELARKKKYHFARNSEKVIVDLKANYGKIRSFLADVYPECHQAYPSYRKRKEKN